MQSFAHLREQVRSNPERAARVEIHKQALLESGGQIAMRLVRDRIDPVVKQPKGTFENMARNAGIAPTAVQRAVIIKRWAPDLVPVVIQGRMPLYVAYKQAIQRRPARTDRTTEGKRRRDERIRQMVDDGHSEDDIARATGLSRHHVATILHREGLETLSQKLHVVRKLDYDAVMERMVSAAEPSHDAIAALDLEALDPKRLAGWQARLTEAIRDWTLLRNQLRRLPR